MRRQRRADAGRAPRRRPGTWPDGRSRAPPPACAGRRASSARAARDADGGMRIEEVAAPRARSARSRPRPSVLADGRARELGPDPRQRLGRDREGAAIGRGPPSAGARRAASRPWASNSRRSKFEETWMSIEGEVVGCDAADLVAARRRACGARMSLALVRDHQALDRQAHALRDEAGEHVAEIAGRHREGDRPVRRAERRRRR